MREEATGAAVPEALTAATVRTAGDAARGLWVEIDLRGSADAGGRIGQDKKDVGLADRPRGREHRPRRRGAQKERELPSSACLCRGVCETCSLPVKKIKLMAQFHLDSVMVHRRMEFQ